MARAQIPPSAETGWIKEAPSNEEAIEYVTRGGLKGGISVALALSLPESEFKPLILTVTYIVVLFSIIVQVLTVAPMARRVSDNPDPR